MMFGAVIGSGGNPNLKNQLDTNFQNEAIKLGQSLFSTAQLNSPSMTNVAVLV
jgi:hypothetical protein